MKRIKAFFTSKTVRAQAARFVRLFGAAVVSSGVVVDLVHGTATRAAIIAALVGAFEVAFRAVVPAKIGTPVGTVTVTTVVADVEQIARAVAEHLHAAPVKTAVAKKATPSPVK